jgi:hypothetical protein
MKLSEIAEELAKIKSDPEPEPAPDLSHIDPATRAARDYIKRMMQGRPGTPFFADEMTPEELRQWHLQNRRAMVPPPRNPWLDPHGDRRSIWDRES